MPLPSNFPNLRRFRLACLLALAGAACPVVIDAMTITIVPGATLASNQPALDAFNRAAAEWSNSLTDNITVTIAADLGTFANNNTIGSTSSVILQGGYSDIRNQLVADSTGQPTNALKMALPTTFTATLAAGSTLTSNISSTKADLKAMGFAGLDTAFGTTDATITFNNAFNFSYATTPVAGKTDFQSVAAHEIGHALGFISNVDSADAGATTITPTVLDLYRFGAASAPGSLAAFTSTSRDLRANVPSVTSDTAMALSMSTGVTTGDGNQASHWKADDITGTFIGIMDPTLANGVQEFVNSNDLRAMELIGYSVVPEPGTWALLMLGVVVIVWKTRRRVVAG